MDETVDPVAEVRVIERELANYSDVLAGYTRWLVLNKVDLLPEAERESRCQAIVSALAWQGPVYRISALRKTGTQKLVGDIMTRLEHVAAEAAVTDEGDYDPAADI